MFFHSELLRVFEQKFTKLFTSDLLLRIFITLKPNLRY